MRGFDRRVGGQLEAFNTETEPTAPPAAAEASPVVVEAPLPRRERMLVRGESAIARSGVVLAILLVAALASTAWWSIEVQKDAIAASQRQEMQAATELLRQSAEGLLANGDISALRRLIADAGRSYKLTLCNIVLPDEGILASSEPSRITVRKLPDEWPSRGGAVPPMPVNNAMLVSVSRPLKIPGKGAARIDLQAAIAYPTTAYAEMRAGISAIGVTALVSLLIFYRSFRNRLRGIGAIREALLAVRAGERHVEALAVAHDFGPEAQAWNDMLLERQTLEKKTVIAQARDTLTERRNGKGDLESAFDALSQGLILVNEKLRAKFANGAAAVLLGAKRDDIVSGMPVADFIRNEKVMRAIEEVAAGTTRRRTTVEVMRKDERTGATGVLKFNVRPVRREDAAAAMVVIEDVTQQRVADEARNSFVAQATHELRTPLTNIRLYVESAIDEGEDNPALRAKCLNVINQETRRLENIVSEMLSVSEIEAGCLKLNIGDLRLDTIFTELQTDFSAQAEEKQLTLKFNLPPKLPAIKADREKLTLSLHNLVGNALKYTPANGSVTVNVDVSSTALRVEVIDTGIGISVEDQARIFDKFYRAKDPRVGKITGTGLGLTLAREVVRLHGGDITVDSQIDKGSTFILSCPINVEAV